MKSLWKKHKILIIVVLIIVGIIGYLWYEIGRPALMYHQGMTYFNEKKYDKAIDTLSKFIKIDYVGAFYPESFFWRGWAYGEIGEYEKAIEDFNICEHAVTNDFFINEKKINIKIEDIFINRGTYYARWGKHEKAIEEWTKLLKMSNYVTNEKIYFNRGNSYYAIKDYDKAISDYSKAIKLNPSFKEVYFNRGLVYREKGDYKKAENDFNFGLTICSNNTDKVSVLINRGGMYGIIGEYQKALKDFSEVIEIDPKEAVAYIGRAQVYLNIGEYGKAKQDIVQALELTNSFFLYFGKKRIYIETKNKDYSNELKMLSI